MVPGRPFLTHVGGMTKPRGLRRKSRRARRRHLIRPGFEEAKWSESSDGAVDQDGWLTDRQLCGACFNCRPSAGWAISVALISRQLSAQCSRLSPTKLEMGDAHALDGDIGAGSTSWNDEAFDQLDELLGASTNMK